jgi:hypothetical protein
MNRTYVYEELPTTTSIRLLHLLPSYLEEPIQCSFTISTVALDLERAEQPVPYEAISYVWGKTIGFESIICEGAVLQVPKTLAAVLRRFRLSNHSRTLWVDAACINQNGSHEKNHHVRIMDAIFRQATQVLFCLEMVVQWSEGHQYRYHRSDFVADILSRKLENCPAEHRSFVYAESYAGEMPRTLKPEDLTDGTDWQFVKDILDVPWFRRAWVRNPVCKRVWHRSQSDRSL